MTPFSPGQRKLLFFSRGRGRGHAIPDIAITRELARLRPDIDVRFVSYGTGARTFTEHGIPVLDLGLPDDNSISATTVLAGRAIGKLQPELVVAHEEFSALPVAKIFGLPTVLLTDFFTSPGLLSMESLWFADHILFLGPRGRFVEPPSAKGKTRYLGPVLREFTYRRQDRLRARTELGLPPGATVVTVLPGSWTEAMAPILKPVLAAFDALRAKEKHLIWLAGTDEGLLGKALKRRRDVAVLGRDWTIDRLMVASDIAITKANRVTILELATLGIRTLSLSHGLNPIDEQCVAGLKSNTTLPVKRFTPTTLARALRKPEPEPWRVRRESCAAALSDYLP